MLVTRQTPFLAALALLVALFGCGNNSSTTPQTHSPSERTLDTKTEMTGSEKPVTTPRVGSTESSVEKPKPVMTDLSKLEFHLPEGWKATYDTNLNLNWDIDKFTKKTDGSVVRNRVEVTPLAPNKPTDMDAFEKKIKDMDFIMLGYRWTEVKAKEKLSDGFFFKGTAINEYGDKKPSPTFVMVRTINGLPIVFHFWYENPVEEGILLEAINIGKSAHVSPSK
jgi:hypothetical protein